MTTDAYLDGNELAGPFRELFAIDITVARGQCDSCGAEGMLAETRVYDRAPGLVVRCRRCGSVLMRLVRGPDRVFLDMRGIRCLQLPLPAS
jgi:ribosomal protein S27E